MTKDVLDGNFSVMCQGIIKLWDVFEVVDEQEGAKLSSPFHEVGFTVVRCRHGQLGLVMM